MWKTIGLCASLFASAALGLAAAARWLEPAVLPASAAIGLCLIGVVLILISPHRPIEVPEVRALPALDTIDEARTLVSSLSVANTGRQPTLH